jgi:hypothetical protein
MTNSPRGIPSPPSPSWIPAPRAWISAVALILLMLVWQHAIAYLWVIISLLINWWVHLPPKFWYLLSLFASLSPIFLVAFLHHWLHKLMDNFFPETRLPETETVPGVFPGVMSWWQGLYGWLVNVLATTIAYSIIALFSPQTELFNILSWFTQRTVHLHTATIIIQIIIAAGLYQFEYVVHQRLIRAARR